MSSTSACARLSRAACAFASARVCPVASSSVEFATVAHAHASILHGARNSGGTGGLLPVQRSTSYCLDNSWSDTGRVEGLTGRRGSKGGVSGPVEDLCPVSEVEAGVKCSAGQRCTGSRLQVHFPAGNQALVPGRVR